MAFQCFFASVICGRFCSKPVLFTEKQWRRSFHNCSIFSYQSKARRGFSLKIFPVIAILSSPLQYKGSGEYCFSPQIIHCSNQRTEYKKRYIFFQNDLVFLFAIDLSAKKRTLTELIKVSTSIILKFSCLYFRNVLW